MATEKVTKAKVTKALARRLTQSKGVPVKGIAFAAVESDKLPLSSFAARAAARDKEVREKLAAIMAAIQKWEQASGQQVPLEVRPDAAAVAVVGPAAFFEALSEDVAVAALDVDA